VGLARAGVTDQHDRLPGVDPRAGGESGKLGGDAGDGIGVEVGQPLEAGDAGFADAAGAAAAGPVVGLGSQDLGKVGRRPTTAAKSPPPRRGPQFVKNNRLAGASSGDHTQACGQPRAQAPLAAVPELVDLANWLPPDGRPTTARSRRSGRAQSPKPRHTR